MVVTVMRQTPQCQGKLVYVVPLLHGCRREEAFLGSIGKRSLDLDTGAVTKPWLLDLSEEPRLRRSLLLFMR